MNKNRQTGRAIVAQLDGFDSNRLVRASRKDTIGESRCDHWVSTSADTTAIATRARGAAVIALASSGSSSHLATPRRQVRHRVSGAQFESVGLQDLIKMRISGFVYPAHWVRCRAFRFLRLGLRLAGAGHQIPGRIAHEFTPVISHKRVQNGNPRWHGFSANLIPAPVAQALRGDHRPRLQNDRRAERLRRTPGRAMNNQPPRPRPDGVPASVQPLRPIS